MARSSTNNRARSLLAILLSALLLSIRLASATKICLPRPVRRPAATSPTTAAVAAAAALPPRGGAAPGAVGSAPPRGGAAAGAMLRSFARTVVGARSHLAAAAAARAISIFAMYPVDTVKTRMQMKQGDAFRMSGVYAGVGGSLAGQVPYGVLTFGSYEIYKQSLLSRFPDVKPAFVYALAAVLGDVTGSGWLCPSEVMKQQLQAGIYPSMKEAIKGIYKKSGVGGFYQGFTGGLARDVPFRVAQLTTFEAAKGLYLRAKRRRLPPGADPASASLSALEAAACGAASGSLSAAVTNPLDRIKTLMMTDTTGAYGGSVARCAARVAREEGAAGLFAGVAPRVAYIAPSVCIFFVAYEFVQQRMGAAG